MQLIALPLPSNTVPMFEVLLSAPITDESVAEDWNQKRLYAMKKVASAAFHVCIHLCSSHSFSHQSASIEKALAQGQRPVAGNPDHDMTLENVERQACLLTHPLQF